MSIDESPDEDEPNYGPSETENVFGKEITKARPIALLSGILTISISIYLLYTDSSLYLVLTILAVGVCFSFMYGLTDSHTQRITGANRDYDEDYTERHNITVSQTKSICRECQQEVSPNVKRCPNCGWKPKKRGGLWWGTTAVMSLNPIGWVMGAKGASDNIKASKGVSKEVSANESDDTEEEVKISPESDPTDTLEQLNELRNKGAITEAEFEAKKKELLDRI